MNTVKTLRIIEHLRLCYTTSIIKNIKFIGKQFLESHEKAVLINKINNY